MDGGGEHSLDYTSTGNVRAIKLCLDHLASEAKRAGWEELATLIDVAAMAAADVPTGPWSSLH